VAGHKIVHSRRRALVGHVQDVDAGHALQQFAGETAREGEFSAAETTKWTKIVRESGAKVD
jgi:hypothetical protein